MGYSTLGIIAKAVFLPGELPDYVWDRNLSQSTFRGAKIQLIFSATLQSVAAYKLQPPYLILYTGFICYMLLPATAEVIETIRSIYKKIKETEKLA